MVMHALNKLQRTHVSLLVEPDRKIRLFIIRKGSRGFEIFIFYYNIVLTQIKFTRNLIINEFGIGPMANCFPLDLKQF